MSRRNYSSKPKALWVRAGLDHSARSINQKSRQTVRSEQEAKYRRQKPAYMRWHRVCACWMELGCNLIPKDIHHMRGRLGSLLNDERYWLPVCREAHDWIGGNPEMARTLGWLCAKGEWNKQGP